MQVIIQPRDGIEPFLEGIRQAEKSVEVILYRLDRLEIEQELVVAAARGVRVHALVTYTNKEDLKEIRKLERRLALDLSVSEQTLYLSAGTETLTGSVELLRMPGSAG